MAVKKSSFKIRESTISMVLGGLVVFIVGALVYNYFTKINKIKPLITLKKPAEVTPAPKKEEAKKLPKKYKVKEGDHLWRISEVFYQSGYNWVDIAKENKLANPDLIYPGQELTIPKVEVKRGVISVEGVKVTGPKAITQEKYEVRRGDNLWDIAVRACGDGFKWTAIARVNNLTNPDIIHAGNVFKITCK